MAEMPDNYLDTLKASYQCGTVGGYVFETIDEERRDAFIALRERILDLEVDPEHRYVITMEDFTIEPRVRIARLTMPDGDTRVIDLLEVEDARAQELLEAYLEHTEAPKQMEFSRNNKGNTASYFHPIQRNTATLSSFSNSFNDNAKELIPKILPSLPTKEARKKFTKRVHTAEFLHRKLSTSLNTRVEDLRAKGSQMNREERRELDKLRSFKAQFNEIDLHMLTRVLETLTRQETPPKLDFHTLDLMIENKLLDTEKKLRESKNKKDAKEEKQVQERLEKEIAHLRTIRQNLGNLDIYTLTEDLRVFPLLDPHLAPLAPVRKLVDELREDIRSKKPISIGDRIKKLGRQVIKPIEPKEVEFIKDVVGMLYTNRWDYYTYCEHNNLEMKQESLTDIFLREAIALADNEEYEAEKLMTSGLRKGFLEEELQQVGRSASQAVRTAIEKLDAAAFETKAPAKDLDEKQRKEHLEAEAKKLQKTFVKLRRKSGIDWKFEAAPIEREEAEEPLQEVAPRRTLLSFRNVALGSAALAGAYALGLPSAAVSTANRYLSGDAYNLTQNLIEDAGAAVGAVASTAGRYLSGDIFSMGREVIGDLSAGVNALAAIRDGAVIPMVQRAVQSHLFLPIVATVATQLI